MLQWEAMQIILAQGVSLTEPWQGRLVAGWPMESRISGITYSGQHVVFSSSARAHLDPWAAESPVTAATVPATVLVIFPAIVPACHGLISAGHS